MITEVAESQEFYMVLVTVVLLLAAIVGAVVLAKRKL